jgi:heme/copper-type cytochrome/quinol oxidase subunit 2
MQPQSKSVDGLIMAMAGSIVAVVVIALLCCCMHRCRKSRPYDERKMTRLEEGASTRESVLYAFRLVGIADD